MAAAPWSAPGQREVLPQHTRESGVGQQEECVRLLVDEAPLADCAGGTGRARRWAYVAVPLAVGLLLGAACLSSAPRPRPLAGAPEAGEFEVLDQERPKPVPDADMMWQSDAMKNAMAQAEAAKQADEEQRAKDAEEAKRLAKEEAARERREEREREAARRQQREAARKRAEQAKAEAESRHDGNATNGTDANASIAHKAQGHNASKHQDEDVRLGVSVFMGALDELLHPPPPLKTEAHGFQLLSEGRCGAKGLFAVPHQAICPRAADALSLVSNATDVSNATGRPAGCYLADGVMWFAAHHGKGADANDAVRQVCMTKARKQREAAWLKAHLAELARAEAARKAAEEKARRERQEARERREKERQERKEAAALKKHLEKEENAILKWEKDELSLPNVSLYCFSLMMPFGYEPGLLSEQQRRGVGIFVCDEWTVFSNTSTLENGEPSPVALTLIPGSLAVAYGGRWMTALNTGVFNRLWMQVIRTGSYRNHDWTVKVDPDAVFFPGRLRELLKHKAPYNDPEVRRRAPEPASLKCGTCRQKGKEHETCAANVRAWQQKGHSCKEALDFAARDPPEDCGCVCDDFACDLPGSAVYLNNCQWGLHGPIEVLSRRAVATYAAGLPKCVDLMTHPWGEDKFVDQCMQQLGVTRADEYSLLSETACGDQPAPCGTSKVSFHPFKSIQSYFACHEYASKYGEGPGAIPQFSDLQAAGITVEQILERADEHGRGANSSQHQESAI